MGAVVDAGPLPAPGAGRLAALAGRLRAMPVGALVRLPGAAPASAREMEAVAAACPAGGAAAGGRAVTSTVKSVREGRVERTLPREGLLALEGPRAFDGTALRGALADARLVAGAGDDEVELALAAGLRVLVVDLDAGSPPGPRP